MKNNPDWSVHSRYFDGYPMSLRLNREIEDFICHTKYVYQLSITLPLSTMDEHGYPYAEEDRLLQELESLLQDRLALNRLSVFVAVLTTAGVRMYLLYTFLPEYCEKIVREIDRDWMYHNLSISFHRDETWEALKGLLES